MNLKSDRLIVTLDPPNQGWAKNNRFDRTGTVTSIILDGKHTFTVPEVLDYRNQTTGGMGLMAEFVCQEFIDAAKVGERYHKPGVGMIERDPGEVNFMTARTSNCVPYEATLVRDGDDACEFVSVAPMLHGWAFTIRRRVQVKGNQLSITATMENQGEKPMKLTEYNHNFVNLDGRQTGPGTQIDLTYDVTPERPLTGAIRQSGKVYTFAEIPERPFFAASSELGEADVYGWTLSNDQNALSISERVSEKACRTQIWGTSFVVSTEVFIPIDLAPGQSKTWTRTWTFTC